MGGGSPQEKTSRQRRIIRTCESERREPYASVGRKGIGYWEMNGNNPREKGTRTCKTIGATSSELLSCGDPRQRRHTRRSRWYSRRLGVECPYIYRETHIQSSMCSTCPENFWARSASPSRQVGNSVCREHEWHSSGVKEKKKKKKKKIFFFLSRR